MIGFLTSHMLRREAQEWLSAAECLSTAKKEGLFDGPSVQTGSDKPMLQPDRGADNINTEEASAIIVGPLWRNVVTPLRKEKCISRSRALSPLVPDSKPLSSHAIVEDSISPSNGSRSSKRRRKTDKSHHLDPQNLASRG